MARLATKAIAAMSATTIPAGAHDRAGTKSGRAARAVSVARRPIKLPTAAANPAKIRQRMALSPQAGVAEAVGATADSARPTANRNSCST